MEEWNDVDEEVRTNWGATRIGLNGILIESADVDGGTGLNCINSFSFVVSTEEATSRPASKQPAISSKSSTDQVKRFHPINFNISISNLPASLAVTPPVLATLA